MKTINEISNSLMRKAVLVLVVPVIWFVIAILFFVCAIVYEGIVGGPRNIKKMWGGYATETKLLNQAIKDAWGGNYG